MLDTEGLYQQSFREMAPQYGREWTTSMADKTMGTNYTEWCRRIRMLWGEDFPAEEFRNRSDALRHEWMNRDGVPKKPGLMELLEDLRAQGIPMAVASSTSREEAWEELRLSGLKDYFAAGVFGDMVSNGKPDPEIYQKAAELLGVSPADCAAVEDSFNGVLSAVNAGCKTVMVPDQKQPTPELLEKIYAKKETLLEVIPLIRQLREESE